MPLYRAPKAGLPAGKTPGKILGVDESGIEAWVDPPEGTKPIFRGEWEQDSLVWYEDFSDGVIPSPWQPVVGGSGSQPSIAGVGPNANYPTSVRLASGMYVTNWSGISLDLSTLGFPGITRVKFWSSKDDMSSTFENYTHIQLLKNGGTVVSRAGTYAWVQDEASVGPEDVIEFRYKGGWTSNTWNDPGGGHIAGVEIFAAPQPFMLGDFVTFDGKMWKSNLNNNPSQPGVNGDWSEVLTFPPASGATASRPDPTAAGVGYEYFDTDLVKPIWSTGTAWVDANGTAV